ncbi:MAG: AAA family ATPase [Bacteroidales bacterium]
MIKISITGPESTGKSWLSSTLAKVFGCPWVPEFARQYLIDINRPYTLEDVVYIAQMQRQAEKEAASMNPPVLFCDTDMIVCKIWCEVKYGFCPSEILRLRQEDDYHLYLLTNIDLPWAYDPLREHPHLRRELFQRYHQELSQSAQPFEIVSGMHGQRLEMAVDLLSKHFPELLSYLHEEEYHQALTMPWLA